MTSYWNPPIQCNDCTHLFFKEGIFLDLFWPPVWLFGLVGQKLGHEALAFIARLHNLGGVGDGIMGSYSWLSNKQMFKDELFCVAGACVVGMDRELNPKERLFIKLLCLVYCIQTVALLVSVSCTFLSILYCYMFWTQGRRLSGWG